MDNPHINIVTRNFIRLLKCGAYGKMEPLEPMNNFKWLKLIRLSIDQECMGIAYEGTLRYINANHITLTDKVCDEWYAVLKKCEDTAILMNSSVSELHNIFTREPRLYYPVLLRGRGMASFYPNPLHYYCSHIDWYIPTEEKAREADAWARREAKITDDTDPNRIKYMYKDVLVENNHFAQEMHDKRTTDALQTLITREKSYYMPNIIRINGTNVEILPPTINLFVQILYVMQHMIYGSLKPQMIIDLGTLVRKLGNQIDYIKIERWLNELKLQKTVDYEGGLLINLFGFKKEELPFMHTYYEDVSDELVTHIFSDENMHIESTHSSAKHRKHSSMSKYLNRDAVSNMFASIGKLFLTIDD